MSFDQQKGDVLNREDKSRKGSIDEHIKDLVDAINAKKDYYTTSSCSGRVVLIQIGPNQKLESKWIVVSHDTIDADLIVKGAEKPFEHQLWFKMESAIIHLVCRNIESAQLMITKLRELGLKRCGIISLGRKIVIEVVGTQGMDSLIGIDGKLLVEGEYLRDLTKVANEKLLKNHENLKKLLVELEKL